MTKNEAIEKMNEGAKVSHKRFSSDEWMKKNGASFEDSYEFEDGVICPVAEFWMYRTESDWGTGWTTAL